MAKNNFKAQEAVTDPNYAQGVGSIGQSALGTGLEQQNKGFSNLSDTYGQQKSFAAMLQDAAAGTGGPTLAEQQLKDATARNNANAAGFAAGAKGLNPALAARQALMAQAGNNQQAAGQAVQTRMQEQQAARAQLGGALAGEAATAGGMTSAGTGLAATGGGLANQSNSNLIQSRQGANQINADVAKQNAGVINGVIGGITNAAGGALGLAEGGVVPGEPEGTQSDETSIALAKGGVVPHAPALPSVTRGVGQPHRSFAAQVAHHLSREYFAEGGMAEHEGYKFEPMDLRDAKPKKPKTEGGAETTMYVPHDYHTPDATSAQHEGEDSEGKKKTLHLNQGGYAGGSPDQSEEDYNPADDEPESDDSPDTDGAIDPDEAEEKGIPRYAEGGEADESAGLDTRTNSVQAEKHAQEAAAHPSLFARIGAGLQAASQGFAGGTGSAVPSMVGAGPSVAQRQAAGPQGPNGPPRLATSKQVREPGGAPAPLMGDKSGAPFLSRLRLGAPAPDQVAGIYASGGPVPGKANVPGNSLKNDVVDAKLSPGEVVLPRTVAHDPEKAKRFVELLMQHGGSGHEALKDIKKRKS